MEKRSREPKLGDTGSAVPILDGTVLRLYHVVTDRRLHSHDVRPPVSEADWQNKVSCYGYEGFEGDANDMFRVEIVKSMSDGEVAKKQLRTIETKFRLIHIMTGCALFSHKVKLPDWGFDQQEVTCAKQGTLPNSIWYVEQNEHPLLREDAEKVNYKNPGFLGKFWELQQVMWTTNAGLVESHAWDSRPPSWPVLRRGINFWGKYNRQIYLLGNPIVWWSSTMAIGLYFVFKGLSVLRWQRGFKDYDHVNFRRFDYEIGQSVLGWFFPLLPILPHAAPTLPSPLLARALLRNHGLLPDLRLWNDSFWGRVRSQGHPCHWSIWYRSLSRGNYRCFHPLFAVILWKCLDSGCLQRCQTFRYVGL